MSELAASNADEVKASALKQKRLANKEEGLAADWALMNGTQLGGMAYFQRSAVVKPLSVGQSYFHIASSELPTELQSKAEHHVRRLCVEEPNGDTRLAVCWSERGSTLHTVVDMGAASFPFQNVMYDSHRGRVSGTYDYDQPHRHHRHHLNALEHNLLSNMASEL